MPQPGRRMDLEELFHQLETVDDESTRFELLYFFFFSIVTRFFCTGFRVDGQQPEDLTQECFKNVLQGIGRLRLTTPAELQGWVFEIARNVGLDVSKKARAQRRDARRVVPGADLSSLESDGKSPLDIAILEEETARLRNELSKENCQELLLELDGLSRSEIAQVLDKSKNAVDIRVSRAKKQLQARWGGDSIA